MDEQILWEGRPKQGFQLVFEDLLIIPFMAFALTITVLGTLFLSKIFVIPLIGVCISIYKRYITDIIDRKTTKYYVTSTAVIIQNKTNSATLPFSNISQLSVKDHPFKFIYGSVIFGEEETIFGPDNVKFTLKRRPFLNMQRDRIAIALIKDYKEVYNLIQQKIAEQNAIKTKK